MERDEFLRAAWKAMVAEEIDARSLVFVDEMGTNTSLSPLYAWAKKGERAYCSVPRNRGPNTTLLSSMSVEGMGPSLAVVRAQLTVRSLRHMSNTSWRPRCARIR
jgi:hypothetical protein